MISIMRVSMFLTQSDLKKKKRRGRSVSFQHRTLAAFGSAFAIGFFPG